MGFIRFKVRIVCGWLMGIYDKERRNTWLAIINKHAREPMPAAAYLDTDRQELLVRHRWRWVGAVALSLVIMVVLAAFAAGIGLAPESLMPFLILPVLWEMCQYPTQLKLHRREQLSKAMLEVAKSTLDRSDR
jgi:hypothetical protein